MPVEFLSRERRERLGRFSDDATGEQLARYFHLDDADRALVERRGRERARLGFALQLLIGVIDDSLAPFRNRLDRRNKRIVALRGLPAQHSSGARMVLEALGMDLESLRASILCATRSGR